MPGVSGVTVVTNACAFYHCARGCGRAERPAFPAPSWGSTAPSSFRGTLTQQLGRIVSRERGGVSLCYCEERRDEAIRSPLWCGNGLLRGACHRARNDWLYDCLKTESEIVPAVKCCRPLQ